MVSTAMPCRLGKRRRLGGSAHSAMHVSQDPLTAFDLVRRTGAAPARISSLMAGTPRTLSGGFSFR
jgi:DNA-binding transcriptional regulator GbsR (MarR family)